MGKKYVVLLGILLCSFSLNAQNLLINGDFESGSNGIGFNINSCCYNELTQPFSGNTTPGNYAVTSNPQPMNTLGFISGNDHTSGTGNMLVVDGTTTGGSQRFWRAGNNGGGVCGMTLGTTYTFSFWVKSVSTQVTNAATQANFGYQIIGANTITLVSGSNTAPLPAAGWQQIVYTFIPTNNCVNIEIWDNNTTMVGNDFAVDDFSLTAPPLPLSLTYSSSNVSCPNASDGTIIGYGHGGITPYHFFLTGASAANNTSGVFTGLAAGNYSLTIIDLVDAQQIINNIVLTAPLDLTVNAPVTICPGNSTMLSVSGSTSGYTWTASPADASLTATHSATPTVSPTQTTTYTVTSTTSSFLNLIDNGDFSSGNTGFLTDYVYYTPNNPSGIQRAYGIVTNANNWESGFSSCTDHTSGSGNMMVVDGSLINSGNDKVWCKTVAIIPNQTYNFSYWIQTVATPNFATIEVRFNGVSLGGVQAPITTCNWIQRLYTWNSGSTTSVEICLYDMTTDLAGNDFALDDFSLVGPPVTCSLSKSAIVTVGNAVVPDFATQLNLCSGMKTPPLATTSPNGITGTWTPNAINNMASGTYIFQPNANQCAVPVTLNVAITTATITPTFVFGTSTTSCLSSPPHIVLSNLSVEGITGVWNPMSVDFSVVGTTVYTFTPAADQCAVETTFTSIVTPDIIPAFQSVNPICTGSNLAILPTTSLNNITGTWSPPLNNMASTTYTFTPAANQCAAPTTLQIIVIPANLIPEFSFGPTLTICYGSQPQVLFPGVSDNGIPGTWNPSIIDPFSIGTTVYTFTPDPVNSCAATIPIAVTISEDTAFTVNSGCDGTDFTLSVVQNNNPNTTFTWYSEQGDIIATTASVIITETGEYKIVVGNNGCSGQQTINVPTVYCKIPKGVSPNTDSFNDTFELTNLNVKNLQIFNRYGTEVYSKSNYTNEWDGKTNGGKELPDGTYYYVIQFATGKSKTGWVYLNKEN